HETPRRFRGSRENPGKSPPLATQKRNHSTKGHMKTSSSGLHLRLLVAVALISSRLLLAATVTDCDEPSLRAAVADGGTVTFACDGTITLANTLDITTNTVLDANGHSVTLSGGGAVRLLQ